MNSLPVFFARFLSSCSQDDIYWMKEDSWGKARFPDNCMQGDMRPQHLQGAPAAQLPAPPYLRAAPSGPRVSTSTQEVLSGPAPRRTLPFLFSGGLRTKGFPGGSDGKESACNLGDPNSIPGLGRPPGGGHGHPLQYSCLENPHGQRSLVGHS